MPNDLIPVATMTNEEAAIQRQQFAKYVESQLKKDQDFGIIPGTDKPTLLQPGADKLLNLYGLTTRLLLVEKIERWEQENPFFKYDFKCSVIWPRKMPDGTIREEVIAEKIGSCNSYESKYAGRWVTYDQLSTTQQKKADAGTLKTEERAEWVIEFAVKDLPENIQKDFLEMQKGPEAGKWKSKEFTAKSGKKFTKWLVPGLTLYQVPNEKIFDQVNTIQKMAQKRAYVGATISATKASDMFTQDMEDLADQYDAKPAEHKGPEGAKPVSASQEKPAEVEKPKNSEEEGAMLQDFVDAMNEKAAIKDLNAIRSQYEKAKLSEAGLKLLNIQYAKCCKNLNAASQKS